MGDLRPLGSEKLEGIAKIKRMIEIATYKETPKDNTLTESKTNTYSIQLADGYTYGIVLEKSGYIIKKGINESTLNYVDDIRQRKYYRSYSEALKRLNLIAAETNRLNENYEGISLLGEQPERKKKFVLKTKKTKPAETEGMPPAPDATGTEGMPPAPDATGTEGMPPAPDATGTEGMPPAPDAEGDEAKPPAPDAEGGMETPTEPGSEDMGMDAEPTEPGDEGEDMGMSEPEDDEMGMDSEDEGGESKVSLKAIQKLTGRLSQKVREYEKEKGMDSQDKKYVLNSLISAINVKSLDDDDRDDIFDKLEQYDDYDSGEGDLDLEGGEMEEPMGGEEMPSAEGEDDLLGGEGAGTQESAETGNEELSAPPMKESVEKILSKYFFINPSEKNIIEEKKKKDYLKNKIKEVQIKKEINLLSETEIQRYTALSLMETQNVKFIGKTNKENLVFVKNGKHIKITPRGIVI